MPEREARVRCEAQVAPFRLVDLAGREELSRVFRYELILSSEDAEVDLKALLGTRMGVELDAHNGSKRYFNGFVADAAYLGTRLDRARYRVALVPWLWFLDRGSDCRIFQNKTVLQIIEDVFGAHAGAEFTKRRLGTYPERDYCVQYRESDFNFVSRLMEDEGIFYFFEHDDRLHRLVLIDDVANHAATKGYETVRYYPPENPTRRERDHLDEWRMREQVTAGKAVLRDYDFEKPSQDLTTEDENPKDHAQAKGELFDFPGGYVDLARGDERSRVRREEAQADFAQGEGAGNAAGLCCGSRFKLDGGSRARDNREYVIGAVESTLTVEADRSAGDGSGDPYRCRIFVRDAGTAFRPSRRTRKPTVQGPQTAVVTGPAGEEMYTDKYGRVKVKFHWDRFGKSDQTSSCWVRVSQAWAGSGYGSIHIPRIGQEVIVDFLEGDPDQPIITGRVYNAQQMPPHTLPAGAVNSGIKSNSTKGGGGSNELTMDDTKGKEKFTIHAQYDKSTTVEHDDTQLVKNNRTMTVNVDETHTVHGKRTQTIDGSDTVTIKTGRKTAITSSGDMLSVTGDRQVTASVSHKLESPVVEATGKTSMSFESPQLEIKGTTKTTIGPAEVTVDGTKIGINGQAEITLSVGGSSIKLDPSGVTIVGPLVKIN